MAKCTYADRDGRLQPPRKQILKRSVMDTFRAQRQIIIIFLAVVLGIGIAFGLQKLNLSDEVILWIGLPGELYMRSLKALIVPLVICLIFNTASRLNPKINGRIALMTVTIFLFLHVIASAIAICLFFVFRPDTRDTGKQTTIKAPLKTSDVFMDLFRNVFPDNIIEATFSKTLTGYTPKAIHTDDVNNATRGNTTAVVEIMLRTVGKTSGVNILGLLTICTALGIAAQMTLPATSTLRTICRECQTAVVMVINWVFWTTPVAVISMIVGSLARLKDISHTFEIMGVLTAAVSVGLTLHMLLVMPLLLFLVTRWNPYTVVAKSVRPMAVAFAATSTTVALPDMIAVCTQMGVHPLLANLVLSMGTSMHKSGSGLFLGFCALYIGQLTDSLDNMGIILVIGVSCTFMSMVIPAIPSSSVVTLILILSSLNIPVHDVPMLFAMEWLLDRFRTIVNCLGDVMVTIVLNALCQRYLPPDDATDDEERVHADPDEGTATMVM